MNDISNIGDLIGPERIPQSEPAQRAKADERRSADVGADRGDSVHISEVARLLSQADELPDIRAAKVSAARQAIAEDPDKFIAERLEVTVDRLQEDLLGE